MPKPKHANTQPLAALPQTNTLPLATQLTMLLSSVDKMVLPIAKDETDTVLGQAYVWDFVQKYAKRKSDAFWKDIEDNNLIMDYKELAPGNQEIGESDNFIVHCKVSNPVNRFNADVLAERMAKSKYKVPSSFTLEAIDKAKVPSSSSRTLWIEERSQGEKSQDEA